jgi:hypothetical protein
VTEPDGRAQQEYVFALLQPLSESMLAELSRGIRASSVPPAKRAVALGLERTRRPATLDGYKKAFSYALARLDRTVEPAHHNYQVRLKAYLESKDVDAQWELDYIDVRFHVGDTLFMGEIKVTGWLRLGEAFRTALGQLLDYGHLHHCRHLVMFLDQPLDSRRLELASSLRVAVVCQGGEKYTLNNPECRARAERHLQLGN